MQEKVVVCLSSGLTPQYKLDILRVLALPRGGSIQFRYGADLIEPKLREDLGRGRRVGDTAALSYVDCTAEGRHTNDSCPIIFCRYAVISASERVGSNFFITYELRNYPTPRILSDAFGALAPRWTEAKEPKGFWCFDAELPADALACSCRLESWQQIIKQLWERRDFHDEPLFFVVGGIYERSQDNLVQRHLRSGQYALNAGKDYELQVLHVHPEGDQRKMEEGIGSVRVTFGEPTLKAITSPILPVDSPYDLKRFRFRSQTELRASLSSVVIAVLDKNTGKPMESQPELYLPVRCTQNWGKPFFSAALIAVLLFAQQYLGLSSKGAVGAGTAVASLIIALFTAGFLVYGLKKPL